MIKRLLPLLSLFFVLPTFAKDCREFTLYADNQTLPLKAFVVAAFDPHSKYYKGVLNRVSGNGPGKHGSGVCLDSQEKYNLTEVKYCLTNDTSISECDNMDYSLYGKCQLIDETGGKPFKIADAILTPQGKCLVRIFA